MNRTDPTPPATPSNPALPLHQVLAEEYRAVLGTEPAAYLREVPVVDQCLKDEIAKAPDDSTAKAAAQAAAEAKKLRAILGDLHGQPRAALCISGGGIRSGTFALGVIQGLAQAGLLGRFHYLSTVSGGGYIGSWLTAWIHHSTGSAGPGGDYCAGADPAWAQNRVAALHEVAAALSHVQRDDPRHPEAAPIEHLRAYSNYLSPRLGLFSADTWTLVAIILRNMFLNWLVLVPFLAGILALPRLAVAVCVWTPAFHQRWIMLALTAGGGALLSLALGYMGTHLPGGRPQHRLTDAGYDGRSGQEEFLRCFLMPMLVAVALLTTAWALWRNAEHLPPGNLWFAGFGLTVHVLSYLGVLVWNREKPRIALLLAVPVSGAAGGWLLGKVLTGVFQNPSWHLEAFCCLAVPLVLGVFLLALTLFVGLVSKEPAKDEPIASDADREWWARASGWVFIAALAWAFISGIALYGPRVLALGWNWVMGLGGLSGALTLLLGSSGKSGANEQKAGEKKGFVSSLMEKAPVVAAPVFAFVLLALISVGTTALLAKLPATFQRPGDAPLAAAPVATAPVPGAKLFVTAVFEGGEKSPGQVKVEAQSGKEAKARRLPDGPFAHREVIRHTPLWVAGAFTAVFLAIALTAARWINANTFSVHGMYRDRLIRAYLGASRRRGTRRPHPFTGFDEKDNIPMRCLWPQPSPGTAPGGEGRRLFHVINIALNLVRGEKLAWQERKAQSFTVTPLHCGSLQIQDGCGYRRTDPGGSVEQQSRPFRAARYGGDRGITIGTALSISGAAVSPNWGYHSSAPVTFILAMFNLRLGWWLGNPGPRGDDAYDQRYPRQSVPPLIQEALGLTDDRAKAVYLSDGGHFDNMGLYEMVLRRCRLIVVSDGEQDGDYAFGGLGMAVRKIRIDLGIPIEFPGQPLFSAEPADRPRPQAPARSAIGRIRYTAIDGDGARDGVVIYLKPVCFGSEPRDVVEYQRSHPEFPHETTGDQFFTESQFESYRALGCHTVGQIAATTAHTPPDADIARIAGELPEFAKFIAAAASASLGEAVGRPRDPAVTQA